MKTFDINNIQFRIVCVCFIAIYLLGITACLKSPEFEEAMYITGTEESAEMSLSIDGTASLGISATASNRVTKDVRVQFAVTPGSLEIFNAKNKSQYQIPPSETFELTDQEAVIKQGTNSSNSAKLTVYATDKLQDGVKYCIPVSIVSSESNLPVLESSRTLYIILNKKITTRVADLSGGNTFNIPSFMTDNSVSNMPQITMECRVLVKSFPPANANPGISSVMGIEENFLLRFGDISVEKNQLQLAPGIVGGKKYFTTGNTRYITNKWYHIAAVYDGSSFAIYVDGKEDVKFSAGPGAVNLNSDYFDGFWIGRSERGRFLNGLISEVRIWNRALSPGELKSDMCYVDPTANGLLAYWRFDQLQTDNSVTDLTGHGHKAIFHGDELSFVENIKCPE